MPVKLMFQLLLLVFLQYCLEARAQKIHFTDPTNLWTFLSHRQDGITGIIRQEIAGGSWTGTSTVKGRLYRNNGSTLLFREDFSKGIIYYRYEQAYLTDTLEHIYFDYNLRIGDTLKYDYKAWHYEGRIERMDSVFMEGRFYKTWSIPSFRFYYTSSAGGSPSFVCQRLMAYTFIEGIGSTAGFQYPIYKSCEAEGDDILELRCFFHDETQPACTPWVELPGSSDNEFTRGYKWVDSFDNTSSCVFTPLSVSDASLFRFAVTVTPNPGGSSMLLYPPSNFSGGRLRLFNTTGQEVANYVLSGPTSIPIGQRLSMAGSYFYLLEDAAGRSRYRGRFAFQ